MSDLSTPRKAVALISGGLDSMLAARTVLDQGVHVEGINFFTGFCVEGHTHAIRKRDADKIKRNNALWCAEQLGIKLHIIDVVEEYKDVVLNPKYGYGAHLNPCLDCKIFMVKRARQWLEENGFDFIITGEVVGQRPKSQRKQLMPIVAAESGADDLLLRPLSAHNLPATKPEREGWVDRDKLHGLHGRSRRPQMDMAQSMGFEDYAQPAGGCCFLTDMNYSKKLQDLWANRGERRYELDDIMLLKIGRHLRPKAHFKMIIAREDGENRFLEGYRKHFAHILPLSHGGPIALIDGDASLDDLQLAAAITARFSQGRDAAQMQFTLAPLGAPAEDVWVQPLRAEQVLQEWYL